MIRNRGPGNLVAHRPMAVARIDAATHDSYAAMIETDLGGQQPQPLVSWRGVQQPAPLAPPGVAKVPTPDIPSAKPPEPKREREPASPFEERSPKQARPADGGMAG